MPDTPAGLAAAGGSRRRGPLRSPGRAVVVSLPMILLSALMLMGGPRPPADPLRAIPLLATYLFVNVLFFEMVRTGKTERYRATLFIATAALFVVSFIANLIEVRGSMQLTAEDTATGQTPFCHMVIPMTLIPAALTKTIIFPGHLLGGFAPIAGMFVLWIGASLALGRGFCAWGCFFGGLEDGFSRLRRRPLIRNISKGWTYAPYAVLLAVVLLSAATLSPVYCEWLCPFKSVTEFFEVNSTKAAIQAGIFVSLFAGLVVALPIATRKRTQCGLFCPFGAFQSITNRVDPFAIRVNRPACSDCHKCETVCPTFSIDAESIARGGTRGSCCKCGRCVDACASGAITYHVKGTGGGKPERARMLFIYPAFLFLAVFGGGMIQDGLFRLLKLATTGRMIH